MEVAETRRAAQRAELRSHANEASAARQKIERSLAAEKQKDLHQLQRYDPWSTTTDHREVSGALRQPAMAYKKSLSRAFKDAETSVTKGYAAKVFGRAGNGAPRRNV